MNTAFNIDYYYALNTGIGRYGTELINAFIRSGIPCQIWKTGYMKQFSPLSSESEEKTFYYPWPRKITDYFWPSLQSLRTGIEWVHSANCSLLPKQKSFRQICMIHDMSPFLFGHMKTGKDTAIWVKRIHNVVRNADCILVNSFSTMADLLNLFPRVDGKVFLTPLGIDHFKPHSDQKKTGEFILNVGTVEPRKNIDGLLKAYSDLCRKREAPPLVIAGMDGFRADEYRELAVELKIEGRVRFTGYISDQELIDLYSKAICLVHPAHHEGFGFTVPEAFTHDLPVAAACTGGLGEFFSECVWPVDPSDIDSIMQGLENALDSGVTAEQASARKKVSQDLTWKNCAEKTVQAMKSVQAVQK